MTTTQPTSKDAPFTTHVEPPAQGGKRYVRCEGCGRELLTDLGGREGILHTDDCPNSRGDA